jgi:hypothetical protein
MEQPHVIILPPIIRTMIFNPENNIFEQSFNSQKPKITPLCKEFKEQLDEHTVDEVDIENKLSCAICQESFLLNEKIIKLPCDGTCHFFHKDKKEELCDGIFPWFEEHNTCPVCRHEFPIEPEPETDPEPESEPEPEPEAVSIETELFLTPEQISELENNNENIIDNRILNEIDEMLRSIINNTNNEIVNNQEENNDENNDENNQEENIIPQQMLPFINNIVREEMLRQREEEELQQAILLSMER